MRELNEEVKQRVLKLFLRALSYDEIAKEVGIAKGSVVKIIDDFRNGKLPIPPGMTDYVDTLRHLAVDLRKHGTSVAHLMDYIEVHIKLRQMGATKDRALDWLESCRDLSRQDVSTKDLIESSIELKRLMSRNNLSYEALIADCKAKLAESDKLNREIEEKERAMGDLKPRYEAEEKRRQETLDAISRAIAAATTNMERYKKELDTSMKEHLAQNNLSWKRIKLVEAIIDAGMNNNRLTTKQQEKIRSEITRVASITKEINQLEQKQSSLELEISHLVARRKAYTESVEKLRQSESDLSRSTFRLANMKGELDSELASATVRLNDINKELDERVENFYITHLILHFLFDPQSVTNEDFDVLVNIMNIIRNNRLGMQPRQSAASRLTIKYKGRLPSVYRKFDEHKVNIDIARKVIAYILVPLVKDEIVSRYDDNMLKAGYEVSRTGSVTSFKPVNPPRARNSGRPIVIHTTADGKLIQKD